MDSKFKIEKGVPMPSNNRSGRLARYPLHLMEVGDSFFVPAADRSRQQASVCNAFRRCASMKFHSSKVEGGVRVWRIA